MAHYKLKAVQNDPIGEERIIEIHEIYHDIKDNVKLRGDGLLKKRIETIDFIKFHFRRDKDFF